MRVVSLPHKLLRSATDDSIHIEDRLEAADKLAGLSKQLAADAFFGIATDDSIHPEDRLASAHRLAGLNEQQGAEVLFEIGTDDSIDTENRREAAEKLTGLDEELAAKAFDNIATDENTEAPLDSESPLVHGLCHCSICNTYSRDLAALGRCPRWRATFVPERGANYGHQRSPTGTANGLRSRHRQVDPLPEMTV